MTPTSQREKQRPGEVNVKSKFTQLRHSQSLELDSRLPQELPPPAHPQSPISTARASVGAVGYGPGAREEGPFGEAEAHRTKQGWKCTYRGRQAAVPRRQGSWAISAEVGLGVPRRSCPASTAAPGGLFQRKTLNALAGTAHEPAQETMITELSRKMLFPLFLFHRAFSSIPNGDYKPDPKCGRISGVSI